MSLFNELKRRNVFRAGAAYVVLAWLGIQVAEILFDAFSIPGWVLRTIIIALAIGFPVTLLLAWIYEITVEGVKRTEDVLPNESLTDRTGRKLNFLIIGLLSIAVALFALDRFVWQSFDTVAIVESDDVSIAVLPFELSSQQVVPFLGQLSGDLVRLIQRSDQLRLASADAVEALPTKMQLGDIAARLGVRYLLNGLIHIEGSNTNLEVSLFDSEADSTVWAENYADAYSQQTTDTIAKTVLEELQINPLLLPSLATDPKAYELYLRARQYYLTDQAEEAESLYREAISLDQRFPAALAGMCALLADRYKTTKSSQQFEEAERHCFRAWTIDDQSVEVQQAIGRLYAISGQKEKAQEAFTAALAINPSSLETQVELIKTYLVDEPALAENQLKKIISQHPGSPLAYGTLSYLYFKQGRYADAVEPARWQSRLLPEDEGAKFSFAGVLMYAGFFSEARLLLTDLIENGEAKSGSIQSNLATLLYFEKDYAGAAALYREAIAREPEDSLYHRNMGDALWHLEGKSAADPFFQTAIVLAKRQLEINSDDFWVIGDLVVGYGSTGDAENFQSSKTALLDLVPTDPQPHYDIAVAASRLGDMEMARMHAEKAFELGYPVAFLNADPDIALTGVSF